MMGVALRDLRWRTIVGVGHAGIADSHFFAATERGVERVERAVETAHGRCCWRVLG